MIVHVSGYGYQKRGAPLWLLNGIRSWRRTHRDFHLFGIFHELFATGRVWNSSFWLSKVQEYVTRGIWKLCDGGLTTNSLYYDQLASWRPEMKRLDHLQTRAVFSNVGEPDFIAPAENRPARMVVFGQPGTELGIYRNPHCGVSSSIAIHLGILEIIDIGTRAIQPPSHLGQIPIMCLGQLARNTVSQYLMSCRFGLLNYDVARLQKSGVFAAYAAHGVIPICIGSAATPPFGLEEGRHFLRWPLKILPDLHAMQTNLRQWYADHSIARHADVLASWCGVDKSIQSSEAEKTLA
jgi:hypothetical protein